MLNMEVGLEDFRKRYAELSDRALLAMNREELIPIAQQCYDVELSQRGLVWKPKAPKSNDAQLKTPQYDVEQYQPVEEKPDWANDAISVGAFSLHKIDDLA